MKRQYRNLLVSYLALLAVLVCSLPVAVFGQVTTATITGTVSDQQGAVIPGVKVSVKNAGTGIIREIETGSGGAYVVPLLPVGTYTVSAEKQGFKTLTTSPFVLGAGDNVREDLALQVGAVTQTVEVTGAPPALQTENATIGTLINPQATEQLPLNGRNLQGLMLLVPGSNAGPMNNISSGNRPDDRRPISAASINGQSTQYNDFLIDGADNNERFIGSLLIKPPIDALAEVKIDTNNYTAAVSRTAGGVINFISKSGTDQMHGSVFEFMRNTDLDARNYFDRPNRAPYHQNQFGGSMGGAIQKGKTFFFGDFEGLRIVQGESYTSTIPTQAMKQGNFLGVAHIFNPYTNTTNPANANEPLRTEYPGDVIPAASYCTGGGGLFTKGCLDPITSQIVQLYPNATAGGANNFSYTGNSKVLNSESYDGRVDHVINSNNTIFARFSANQIYSNYPGKFPYVNQTFTNPFTGGTSTINDIQPGGGAGNQYYGLSQGGVKNALVGWTDVISPTFVMDTKLSYSRFAVDTNFPNWGKPIDGALGIPNAYLGNIGTSGLTSFAISGYDWLGDQGAMPLDTTDNGYELVTNLNWQHGTHSIKFGGRYERRLDGILQSSYPDARMTFDGNLTKDLTGATAGSGNPVASFLLGTPASTSRSYSLVSWVANLNEAGLYVQDDWQASKSLTFNLGVRWDYFPSPTYRHNLITNLDFNMSTPTFYQAGTGPLDTHGNVDAGNHDFEPRIGFAKRFGENTVLRGGFGISFSPTNLSSQDRMQNPPYISLYTATATPAVYANTIDQGFPIPGPLSLTDPLGTLRPMAFNYPNAYAQQLNLTAERNWHGYVFRLGGVGVESRHVWSTPDINQAPPGAGAVNPRRPYYGLFPHAGGMLLSDENTTSNYWALQFSAEHRFTHGFSLLANYTWSHVLDQSPAFDAGSPDSEADRPQSYTGRLAEDYGNSDQDLRQRVVLAGVYELPFGKSLKGVEGVLGKGWQVNGILTMQSGFNFTAVNASSIANTGDPDRPDQVGDWHASDPNVHGWFNTAAFVNQPAYTLGTAGRNTMVGPPFKDLDFSIFKNFKLSERFTLQFRAESFNLPNHANFDLPGNLVGSAADGVISDTANNQPRLFQFALKLQF